MASRNAPHPEGSTSNSLTMYNIDIIRIYVPPAAHGSNDGSTEKYDEFRAYVESLRRHNDHEDYMIQFKEELSSSLTDIVPYSISIGPELNYQLTSTSDGKPIPRFPQSDDEEDFFGYLAHLARYENLRKLRNPFPPQSMYNCLEIEIDGVDIMPHCVWNPMHLESKTPLDVKVGSVSVRLRNISREPFTFRVTAFDFTPFWGSYQYYPGGDEWDYDTFLPGEEKQMDWGVNQIPPGWDRSVDYIDSVKLIISKDSLNDGIINSLSMENLDKITSVGSRRGDLGLEEVLRSMGSQSRGSEPTYNQELWPWTTLMFRIRTVEERA
ncbi:hypothetical protein GGR51DRAFT_539111 [Nemania sp. FL0031]|nr:hypothetical protein GGR51DRAFT_539111 [Nemania sp. FL0031]